MARIVVCAPATPISREVARRVGELAAAEFPEHRLTFHPQCFAEQGHFAGSDDVRLAALLECANDPAVDAVWFAKGGYGSNRIAAEAVARMGLAARGKQFLGYSDSGYLLAALYRDRIGVPIHAPMPGDIRREGGGAAVRRVLAWLNGNAAGLERSLDERPTAAFNLTTLAMLLGTELVPDLSGHVVLVEEVAEHLYAVDRLFFHVTQQLRGIAGLRLGRLGDVPENDRPFGYDAEEIARHWCDRAGVPFLGAADIGHDSDNAIVPFGLVRTPALS
ncbi:MAG: LD-carboxypeptidase [Sphingomonadales bacterium 12-68-11]|nr:MAG: LD-carboxypeptidase [Sphingomonadales bacterium 12-68-11]